MTRPWPERLALLSEGYCPNDGQRLGPAWLYGPKPDGFMLPGWTSLAVGRCPGCAFEWLLMSAPDGEQWLNSIQPKQGARPLTVTSVCK